MRLIINDLLRRFDMLSYVKIVHPFDSNKTLMCDNYTVFLITKLVEDMKNSISDETELFKKVYELILLINRLESMNSVKNGEYEFSFDKKKNLLKIKNILNKKETIYEFC